MTPQQQKIALFVLLLLALGVALWWGFFRGGATGGQDGAPAPATGEAAVATGTALASAQSQLLQNIEIDALLEDIQEVTFDYEEFAKDARNPMTPLVGERQYQMRSASSEGPASGEALPPELQYAVERTNLTGIIWDKDAPLAVVDNEVVGLGDELPNMEGIVVDTINVDHIVVRIGDALYPVELKEH